MKEAANHHQPHPEAVANTRPRAYRCGFTLVELLVVIAIIALLVSIIMPSLSRAKTLVKTVICSSNLHSIGQASGLYAGDNGGYAPRDYWWDNNLPGDNLGHYLFAAKFTQYLGGGKIPSKCTPTTHQQRSKKK